MASFKTRIRRIAGENGRIILANDYNAGTPSVASKTVRNIERLHSYICGIKINFHLLLPLGYRQIARINAAAHERGLECIADIKLNDIGNTNRMAASHLWEMGFDAVIVNPIMGKEALGNMVCDAHRDKKGVISLCHMSAPEADSYELSVKSRLKHVPLYELFLDWAVSQKADGIIAGATYPNIIRQCRARSRALGIYSPGIGAQGGEPGVAIAAGTDYLIAGRTILYAKDPVEAARALQNL